MQIYSDRQIWNNESIFQIFIYDFAVYGKILEYHKI